MKKIWSQINNDLKTAMRQKDEESRAVLRMLLAGLKNRIIEIGQSERDNLDDEQAVRVVKSEIKKRKDAIESYEKGNRPELARKEAREIKILERYMPEMMNETEIENAIREILGKLNEASKNNFGRVMGEVMKEMKDKADGQMVKKIVQKILAS